MISYTLKKNTHGLCILVFKETFTLMVWLQCLQKCQCCSQSYRVYAFLNYKASLHVESDLKGSFEKNVDTSVLCLSPRFRAS